MEMGKNPSTQDYFILTKLVRIIIGGSQGTQKRVSLLQVFTKQS